jgi:hypothetical protein
LWHVRKAWAENVVRKIINPQERSNILSTLGRIMYSWGCPIDVDLIFWVEQEIEMLATKFPNAWLFIQYFKKHWL